MRGRTPVSFAVIACCAKTWVSPIASRRRSDFDRLRTYPWKRRSATTAAMSPLTTMPSRKSAGNRKRSELNIRTYKVSLGLDRIARGPDLVADPPHGHDRRGLAELSSQLPNVDVHGAGVAGERVTPDPLEELVPREHEPTVIEQLPQQIELLGSELDLVSPHLDLTAPGV